MPGWHKNVKDLVASGELVLLGVTQEQHAERCQLFAQWQNFDWPILHDPINLLACNAVPITVAIDELGMIRSTNPKEAWLRDEFLQLKSEATKTQTATAPIDVKQLESIASKQKTAAAYQRLGDAIMLWQPESCDEAVRAYQLALKLEDSPMLHFRLGVAMRHRYESVGGAPTDFGKAVEQWRIALRGDANQYIWRRRIQQYGPRLDKPYPFYDWVEQAIADLKQRGEALDSVIELAVPLSGAEVAQPKKSSQTSGLTKDVPTSPDPEGKVTRDPGRLIRIDATVVPSSQARSHDIRLHLSMQPTGEAAWNNEVEPVQVWFEDTVGYTTATYSVSHRLNVATAESRENRSIEAEFAIEEPGNATIRGFVLYHVCEKSRGQCIFRRQDFTVPIRID